MKIKKEKRPNWTAASMYPIIQRWENSGISQIAFVRQEGLNQVVFGYWLRKYREAQNAAPDSYRVERPRSSRPGYKSGSRMGLMREERLGIRWLLRVRLQFDVKS